MVKTNRRSPQGVPDASTQSLHGTLWTISTHDRHGYVGNNLANDTPIKIAQVGTPAGCPQIVFLGCTGYKTFKNVFGIDRTRSRSPRRSRYTHNHLLICTSPVSTGLLREKPGGWAPPLPASSPLAGPEGVQGSGVLKSHQVTVGSSRGRAQPLLHRMGGGSLAL